MRKSRGDKRSELGPDDIARITELYGDFTETKQSKIFPNEHFGYRRIVVERPRRYRYHVTDDAIELVQANKYFEALIEPPKGAKDLEAALAAGERNQRAVLAALDSIRAVEATDPKDFDKHLKKALKAEAADVPAQLVKAIVAAAAEQDDDAPAETDSKGNPLPDSDLRDNENVPLVEDIDDYVEREVLPYVPDAWVDRDKTKVGYEIPFTREFYEYVPPRPLEEIDAEIETLEQEILALLNEVRR
jgi:type I restriction enzyme M protein